MPETNPPIPYVSLCYPFNRHVVKQLKSLYLCLSLVLPESLGSPIPNPCAASSILAGGTNDIKVLRFFKRSTFFVGCYHLLPVDGKMEFSSRQAAS